MDLKYDIMKHPNIGLSTDGGGKPFVHGRQTESIASLQFPADLLDKLKNAEFVTESDNDGLIILTEEEIEKVLEDNQNGKNQKLIGTPLTTNLLVSNSGNLSSSQTGIYTPIHRFGSNVPANLNQYNTTSGGKQIYVFFRTNVDGASQIGTTLAASSIPGYIISFVVGAGLAAVLTYVLAAKKRKTNEAAAN